MEHEVVIGAATGAHSARRVAWQALAVVGLLAVYLAVVVRTAWVSDDAFITLRVVDNWVRGYGLRWNTADRVQVFTHPLWLLLLSGPYALTREPFYTTVAVSTVTSVMVVYLVVRRVARDARVAVALAVALLASNSYVDFSTSGLENPLTHLFVVAFALLLLAEQWTPRALLWLSTIAGLATLNRMDSLLLFLPGLGLAALRCGRGGRAGAALYGCLGFAPFLAWELFATVYYGSPFPNTALAKLNAGVPSSELARQGLLYLYESLRSDPVTLLILTMGLPAALFTRRATSVALAIGAWLYVLYVVRIGGDFMSGRFLSAPLVMCVCVCAEAVRHGTHRWWIGSLSMVLLASLGPRPAVLSGRDCSFELPPHELVRNGIEDERRYYFMATGLLNGQEGFTRPWPGYWMREVGEEAARQRLPVLVAEAVGMKGYFAGPAVHVVDTMALGDPLLSRLQVRGDRSWRIGHFERTLPAGYLRTLVSGRNEIQDPEVRALWERVSVIVRGPIWTAARFAEILRLNLGEAPRIRPQYATASWDELVSAAPRFSEPYVRRAVEALERGDRQRAFEDAHRAIAVDEADVRALGLIAKLHLDGGRPERAEPFVRKAIAIRGDSASFFELGASLAGQRRHLEAARAYLASAGLDRARAPRAWAHAAVVLQEAGETAAALRYASAAAALAPRDLEALLALGNVLLLQGSPRSAADAYARARAVAPDDVNPIVGLATSLWADRRSREGFQLLDDYVLRHPDDLAALHERAGLRAATGDLDGARRDWRVAAEAGHEPARIALRQMEAQRPPPARPEGSDSD